MSTIDDTVVMPTVTSRSRHRNRNPKAEVTCAPGDRPERCELVADEIWRRAYQKWEAAGSPAGDGARFWWEAKEEVLQGK